MWRGRVHVKKPHRQECLCYRGRQTEHCPPYAGVRYHELHAIMRSKIIFCLLAISAILGAAGYHVANKIAIGGDGGWDYVAVDPDARRVYVSHATEVGVLDADSGAVVGKITELQGVDGVAISPDISRGFISNGQSGAVPLVD